MYKPFTANDHNAIVILIISGLTVFFSLGAWEIQPWDEALYAVRAKAIVTQNDSIPSIWWDQTPAALGGLYSSTYPPLSVWAIASAYTIFGETPFATRLFSAICSVLTLLFLYLIVRRYLPMNIAAVVPVFLAASVLWNHYARTGMTDVPLILWIVLSLWSVLQYLSAKTQTKQRLYAVLYSASFAAALLTKITVSLLPLLWCILPLCNSWFEHRTDSLSPRTTPDTNSPQLHPHTRTLLFSAFVGILIALPWYVAMAVHYGGDFWQALFPPHLYSVVENNSRSLGVLYYINQLVVASPIIGGSFYWFGIRAWLYRRTQSTQSSRPLHQHIADFTGSAFMLVCALWFLGTCVVFSLAPTKMPHYTLLMLIPALILGASGIEQTMIWWGQQRRGWMLWALMTIMVVWSSSQTLRDFVQSGLHQWMHWQVLAFLSLVLMLILVATIRSTQTRATITQRFSEWWLLIIPYALMGYVAYTNIKPDGTFTAGGAQVFEYMQESSQEDMMILYHPHNYSDTLFPNLAWYTNGWIGRKKPDKSYRYTAINASDSPMKIVMSLDSLRIPIVYILPQNNDSLIARMRYGFENRRRADLITPSYIVYSAGLFIKIPESPL